MNDVEARFARIAAVHPRCFWLDSADGSGPSLLGWLEDDDLSLTYDAARREVTRHRAGRADTIRLGIFDALEAELRDSDEDTMNVVINRTLARRFFQRIDSPCDDLVLLEDFLHRLGLGAR